MSDRRVVLSLYRSLLGLANKMSEGSALRAALHRSSVMSAQAMADARLAPQLQTQHEHYELVLASMLGQQRYFLPSGARSIRDCLRAEFRDTASEVPASVRIDVAFMFLKKFSVICSQFSSAEAPVGLSDAPAAAHDDGRLFALQQQEQALGAGMLLAAHPMLEGAFHRTVVLLLQHGASGSYGLVLNRPSPHTVSSAVRNLPADFMSAFGAVKVRIGGPMRRMQVIHRVPEMGGSPLPVMTSSTSSEVQGDGEEEGEGVLYAGINIKAAVPYMKQHPADGRLLAYFVGCALWGPGQLQEELAQGTWIVAQPLPGVLSKLILRDDHDQKQEQEGKVLYRDGLLADPMDMYQRLLRDMGEGYEGLAAIPSWVDETKIDDACHNTY